MQIATIKLYWDIETPEGMVLAEDVESDVEVTAEWIPRDTSTGIFDGYWQVLNVTPLTIIGQKRVDRSRFESLTVDFPDELKPAFERWAAVNQHDIDFEESEAA